MERVDPMYRLAAARREFGEYGGVNPSIEVSTTFTVLDASTMPAIFAGDLGPDNGACYLYGRSFSPTVRSLGRQLAAIEHTEAGYACSSGMSAIAATILALCNHSDHVVSSNAVYGGTHALFKTFLPLKCNIGVSFVDISDLEAVEAAFKPNTKVLYTESVSNPTLVVADLPRLAAIAHRHGAALVVDNTFAPLIITPADWGADVVIHSMTKFISGSSDIIAGGVCGSAAFIRSLMDLHAGPVMLLGPTMDPRIASELMLRLPHLGVRVREHCTRALELAARLERLGGKVVYPGLPSHPQHQLLKKLANPGYGFGGLMGIDMGSQAKAEALMERLQNRHGFGLMAVSLGYVDTLMSLSAASTSSELSAQDLEAAHISGGYLRMSVGITGTIEQRWSQLAEAFTFVTRFGAAAPYRATRVRIEPDGTRVPLESWPSFGPGEDGPVTAAAAAAGAAAANVQHAAASWAAPSGASSDDGYPDAAGEEQQQQQQQGSKRQLPSRVSSEEGEGSGSPTDEGDGGAAGAGATMGAAAAAAGAGGVAGGPVPAAATTDRRPTKIRRVTCDCEIVYHPCGVVLEAAGQVGTPPISAATAAPAVDGVGGTGSGGGADA